MALREGKLYVAFLWHMHQPWYLWDESGEATMPWVRLHALKDYYDMPLLVQSAGIPVTINLVPSLLKQIELLALGKSTDPYWETFILDPSEMSETELTIVASNFFNVNIERFIKPSERYSELFGKKGKTSDWRVFSTQEIRDIQVHFFLSWLGESLKKLPEIKSLIQKDRDYTADDKRVLIEVCQQRIKSIIPYYRQIAQNDFIQLTTSPFYHPILPLLCDLSVAQKANPLTKLPKKPFIYPQDAARQVKSAVEFFKKLFQKSPLGMWPPEGSISEEILPILIDSGIEQIFGDEDVLKKSLELSFGEPVELTPQRLYRPYRIHRGKSTMDIFFRDKRLSDKIGFVYYKMDETDAVSDFISSLRRIKDALPNGGKNYIVSIILDGENAWEYYRNNGRDFLEMLYARLLDSDEFQPITFEQFTGSFDDAEVLDRLAPGSWINGNFDTWCGCEEKNKAWELLSDARSEFHMSAEKYPPSLREKVMHHLLIAEGSDWFWWLGETNYTPYIDIFDDMFRFHLRKVYQLLELPVPADLEKPIQVKERPLEPVRLPLQFMTPALEGKATTYFEWSSAGFYKATGFRGAMYSSSKPILQRIFFGFDPENLYLRLDSTQNLSKFLKSGGSFSLEFLSPRKLSISISCDGERAFARVIEVTESGQQEITLRGFKAVCDQICEMKIPFTELHADPENPIRFVVYVRRNSSVEQRFPAGGQYMEIVPPDEDFEDRMWYV